LRRKETTSKSTLTRSNSGNERCVTVGVTRRLRLTPLTPGLDPAVNFMTRIGYARVSTIDQDLHLQRARLTAEGCTPTRSKRWRAARATVIPNWRP
jgi:hypothetical protein